MAVSTGLPLLVAAWWILAVQAWLWRQWLWHEVGGTIQAVAVKIGGPVRVVGAGWEVRGPDRRVRWVAGLHGVRTRVDGVWHDGLLDRHTLFVIIGAERP